MLALAAGVQSSLIGAHAPGVSYVTTAVHPAGPWGGPWGAGHLGAWGGHAAVDHGAWGGPWGGPWGAPLAGHGLLGAHAAIPGIGLAQGPGLGHGHGVYVAKTRGAVHTAPLAGHIASATSVNVAPAPGTH